MKAHYRTKYKTNTSNLNHKKSCQACFQDPDCIAEELERLARHHLPDRVLQGIMTGHEEDIRQEAILLALSWFLRNETAPLNQSSYAWHAPRAIAGALKIIKRDYLKALKGEEEALHTMIPYLDGAICHPVMIREWEWPTSTMRKLVRRAIRAVHKAGKISSLNAAIAMEAFVDGSEVSDIARRCGVHTSNIYQHLTRTRRHLPAAIAIIEVPFNQVQ